MQRPFINCDSVVNEIYRLSYRVEIDTAGLIVSFVNSPSTLVISNDINISIPQYRTNRFLRGSFSFPPVKLCVQRVQNRSCHFWRRVLFIKLCKTKSLINTG